VVEVTINRAPTTFTPATYALLEVTVMVQAKAVAQALNGQIQVWQPVKVPMRVTATVHHQLVQPSALQASGLLATHARHVLKQDMHVSTPRTQSHVPLTFALVTPATNIATCVLLGMIVHPMLDLLAMEDMELPKVDSWTNLPAVELAIRPMLVKLSTVLTCIPSIV
jgi:primosomal replication protein N